ncbi:MAG: MerR family transcriptional regulator [Peptostreptococcaceae bacterium]
MDNKILIGDFVKLTRSTLKTVLYYHKIGLLKEPIRTSSGYRLYGAEELAQMRNINNLKQLGLDLKQIKEILGNTQENKSTVEVLQSLHTELVNEKKSIEERISKIEVLLSKEIENLNESAFESKSFNMITEVLEPDSLEDYKKSCPEMINHHQKVFSVIDDFQWEKDYKDNLRKIAEYFKEHPEQHRIALEFGKRLANLKDISEDDPEIENLAREGAEFVKNEPILKDMLYGQQGYDDANENLFNEISNKHLSPAQRKHKILIQKYLNYKPQNNK